MEDSLETSMDSLENDKITVNQISQNFEGWTKTSSRSGPVFGESISDGVDQDSLNSNEVECSHNINKTSYTIDHPDNGDLNEYLEDQGTMCKSRHGRTISKKGLSFFVDFDSYDPPSSLNRSLTHP
jgi:hypothetical protein